MTAKEAKKLRKRLEKLGVDGTVLPWGTLVINDEGLIRDLIALMEDWGV